MRFILAFLLTASLAFLAGLKLEWWSIAVVAFVISILIPQDHLAAFLSGFIGLFLLWGLLSLWISIRNGHILAHRVSLLIFKTDSPLLLVSVTALIGAMVAGFAALSGSFVRPSKRKD